jgi:UDP-3-O-[3-hydroxymyristoyl] glucosamine N-acyltransferase
MRQKTPSATAGPYTVAELAERLGGELDGDGGRQLSDVRGLAEAGPEHLSFLSNRKYVRQLEGSRAGAVLMDRDTGARGHTAIRLDDPYAAFARALALFHPQPWPEPGIDPKASVAPDAVVEGVTVEAFAVVGPGARVGRGSWIEAGAYVGAGVTLGERCRLMPGSVVYAGAELGDRVWLNPGAVVGSEGFGFAPRPDGHVKIPQTGRAVVESDVEIGANSCVDRSTMGETRVRRGSKLDNLVQVGHGVDLGEGALMAAYSGVAGSTKIGKGVIFAAKSGAINHLKVGDGTVLSTQSVATSDQPAGAQLAGTPAIDRRVWLRSSVIFGKLPEMLKRLRTLERRVVELEEELAKKG